MALFGITDFEGTIMETTEARQDSREAAIDLLTGLLCAGASADVAAIRRLSRLIQAATESSLSVLVYDRALRAAEIRTDPDDGTRRLSNNDRCAGAYHVMVDRSHKFLAEALAFVGTGNAPAELRDLVAREAPAEEGSPKQCPS
jgi:hypothetical protein